MKISEAEIVVIQQQVKELMIKYGLDVHDKGMVKIQFFEEAAPELNFPAYYLPELHQICMSSKIEDINHVKEGMAHELCHSFQLISTDSVHRDPLFDEYWNQRHEQEAYFISAVWYMNHGPEYLVDDLIRLDDYLTKHGMEHTLNHVTDTVRKYWLSTQA